LKKRLETEWHIFKRKTAIPKPLRIKVLSIKEQKLMEITNAEAETEVGTGFKYPKKIVWIDFWECYKSHVKRMESDCVGVGN